MTTTQKLKNNWKKWEPSQKTMFMVLMMGAGVFYVLFWLPFTIMFQFMTFFERFVWRDESSMTKDEYKKVKGQLDRLLFKAFNWRMFKILKELKKK